MAYLDPSYIRYIYDGLEKGELHPDNAAALPDGLTGLYEAAFEESKPARERQTLLNSFAIWALLKKEVSSQFVAEILEVPTEEIVDFIAIYSNWYTSPESAKYQLYHERLKVFLLQKLSEQEIATLHNKLVTRLEQAVAEQKQDEFELYGLEFLSLHYFTTAMITGDGKKLIALSYDQNHWQRQIKLSKAFEWTKKGLKQVISWASKFNDDEVIECCLQMVDLHHQEQNDAPQIVGLVADGEIATALRRIEAFGGNDKEGLQRKFILYMLCLMELTLLESKDKPFRKEAIEKILKHFDENIPEDHSILNWDDFFPSYKMYLMACECVLLELDYLILFSRTESFRMDWLENKTPYNDLQIEVLVTSTISISNNYSKSQTLANISSVLMKQGKVEEALTCVREIFNKSEKISALADISTKLFKLGKVDKAETVMQEALAYVKGFRDELGYKDSAVEKISILLVKQGKHQEALLCIQEIDSYSSRYRAYMNVNIELNKLGIVDEAKSAILKALSCSKGFDKKNRSIAMAEISIELAKQGKVDEAASAMQEALTCAWSISDESDKNSALANLSTELAKQGKHEEALTCARGISSDREKNSALANLSTELAKQGKHEEALECSRGIEDEYYKCNALSFLSTELAKHGMHDEAISCANSISDETVRYNTIKNISTELTKLNFEEKALKYVENINNIKLKFQTLADILLHLTLNNKLIESLTEDLLSIINKYELRYDQFDSSRLIEISTVLNKNGLITKSEQLVNIAIEEAEKKNLIDKNYLLGSIVSQLIIQDKTLFALDIVHEKFDENLFDIGIKVELKKDSLNKITKKLILQNDGIKILSVRVGNLSNQEKNIISNQVTSKLLNQNILNEPSSYTKEIKEAYDIFIKFRDRQEFEKLLNKTIDRAWAIDDISEYYSAESHMILNLVDIAIVLKEIGESEKSNELIDEVYRVSSEEISDEYARVLTLIKMYHKLKGKDFENIINKLKEEITVENIHDVIDNSGTGWRSILLKEISIAKYCLENLETAEKVSFEIERMDERIECWMELAKIILEEMGWKKAINQVDNFQNNLPKKFYLKGLANNLNAIECNTQAVLNSYRYYINDIQSLEKILYQYALHETFFGNAKEKKIQRYNRTLNIQWAIDIKNQLPN